MYFINVNILGSQRVHSICWLDLCYKAWWWPFKKAETCSNVYYKYSCAWRIL